MMKKITLMFGLLFVCFCWQAHSQTSPVNDDLANAVPLIMGASCTNDFFTNTGATAQTGEPEASCFTGATHTVWFSFTAPASGAVEITTDVFPGNIGDTQIALYPAPTDLNDLSTLPPEVGCDQDGGTIVSNGTSTYMSTLEAGGMTPGDTYYVQVDGWNGTTGDFCVQVTQVTCPDPSNLTVSDLTDTSAEINWFENGTASMWDIEYGPVGFAPTGTPTVEDVTNPYPISGLTKNTSYEVYVRSDCGGGDVSDWAGPIGFTTICAGLPYVESFSNGTFPDCWTRTSTTDVSVVATCDSRSNVLNISDTNDVTTVSLDGTSATTDLKVSYYIGEDLCGGATEDPLDVSYWDGTQWVVAKTYETTGSEPYDNAYFLDSFIVPLSDVTTNFQVRFSSNETQAADNWYIDQLIVQEVPTCLVPSGLTAASITANSADLSWTDTNTPVATTWDVHIVPAGDPAPTSTTTPTDPGVTNNPYPVSTLNPSTSYDFYVRSDCGGGDTSLWAGPFAFATNCLAESLPYTESFSNGFPICWTRTNTTDVTVEASCSGRSNVLHITATADATTGLIDATAATNGLKVSYYIGDDLCGSATEDPFDVSYWDGTQWVVAKTYETDTSVPYQNAYFFDSFLVPQADVTANFQVRFSSVETINGDDWYIDELVVQETPTCLVPSGLTAASITANSADLSWTDTNTPVATTWDVHIVPAGDPAPTSTTTPTNPGVTANPYPAAGLNPSTSYDFYVRADCGGGDFSIWAGPFGFATNCLAESLPYSESFSSGAFPICWTRTNTTDVTVEASCSGRSNVLHVTATADATTGLIDATAATNGLKVSYYIGDDLCGSATEDPFDVSYWDGTQWVVAKTYETDTSVPYQNAYFFDSFLVPQADVTANFQVRFSSVETINGDDWYIDELVVQETPTCLVPTGLTAASITANSADLSWTENNTPPATTWDVHIVPAGSPTPTSTTTPTNPGVTANPYPATLNPSTSYDFYVRSDCGGGDFSIWAGPFTFSTACGATTAPYTENFDAVATPALPNCWSANPSSAAGSDVQTVTSVDGGGVAIPSSPNAVEINNTGAPIVVSPEFSDLPTGQYQISVKILYEGGSGTTWTDALIIGVMGDPTDSSTFVPLYTVDAASVSVAGFASYTFALSNTALIGNRTYVAFQNNDGSGAFEFYIDDFVYSLPPTCLSPSSLTATSVMTTTADLGWTENNTPPASTWDVHIVPAGDPAPTGTTTPTDPGVTTNPYTASTLNPSTTYDFYVRANCGGGDLSLWAGPFTFATDCQTASFPYNESFSSGFPACWTRSNTTDVSVVASCSGRSNVLNVTATADATTVPIDITTASSVVVSYYVGNDLCGSATEDTLEVSYWDGSQWVTAITYTSTSGAPYDNAYFQEFLTVPFSDFSTDFKIRFSSTETINGDDWYIDELVVGPSPCSPPTAISIGSITDTTADVTWTAGGSETEWEIEYGPTGFAIGTGMILLDNNGTPGETLTDLAPETTYDAYVRALCTQFTSVAGPETFTTAILDCPSVTNITVVDVTETSFEVNWTAGGAETSWKIEYGPVGFTPGTGIVVIDNDGIGEVIIGLDPDTQYDVYVSAICDGFDGVAIGPVAFDTFMGIEDQVFEGFSFYPNPVSGQLYLNASSQVQEVVIYNLLGQKIMKITPDSLAPTLDLSNLQTGTYLMQVTIKGSKGVYKILKE